MPNETWNVKKIKQEDEVIYPVTHEDIVFDSNGIRLGDKLKNINASIQSAALDAERNIQSNIDAAKKEALDLVDVATKDIDKIEQEIITARDGEESLNDRLNRDYDNMQIKYTDIEGYNPSGTSNVGYINNIELLGNTVLLSDTGKHLYSVGEKVNEGRYKLSIVSTGQNLCPNVYNHCPINDQGEPSATTVNIISSMHIPVKPNGVYNCLVLFSNDNVSNTVNVSEYDINKSFIKKSSVNGNITLSANTKYVILDAVNNIFDERPKSLQLIEGDKLYNEHIEYVEDKYTMYLPTPLDSLLDGNGNRHTDRLYCENGKWFIEKHTRTVDVNKELTHITLQNDLSGVNCHAIGVTLSLQSKILYASDMYSEFNEYLILKDNNDDIEHIRLNRNSPYSDLYVWVAKEKINYTIEEARAYINSLNIRLIVATDEVRILPLGEDINIKLNSFTKYTSLRTEGGTQAYIKCSLPETVMSSISGMNERLTHMEGVIDNIDKLESSTETIVTCVDGSETLEGTHTGYISEISMKGSSAINLVKEEVNIKTTGLIDVSDTKSAVIKNRDTGAKVDVGLYGETLVNVWLENEVYGSYNLVGQKIPPSGDGFITLTTSSSIKFVNAFCKDMDCIKINTDYTVIAEVVKNTLSPDDQFAIHADSYTENSAFRGDVNNFIINGGQTGVFMKKLKSFTKAEKDATVYPDVKMGVRTFLSQAEDAYVDGNQVVYRLLVLEGDWTNKPIPGYFKGVQSSFENNEIINYASIKETDNLTSSQATYVNILNDRTLSAGKQYTIIADITSTGDNTHSSGIVLVPTAVSTTVVELPYTTNGKVKYCVKAKANINTWNIGIKGVATSGSVNVKFNNIMVLEGDWTEIPVPYFEGLKYYAMVKSNNRNLVVNGPSYNRWTTGTAATFDKTTNGFILDNVKSKIATNINKFEEEDVRFTGGKTYCITFTYREITTTAEDTLSAYIKLTENGSPKFLATSITLSGVANTTKIYSSKIVIPESSSMHLSNSDTYQELAIFTETENSTRPMQIEIMNILVEEEGEIIDTTGYYVNNAENSTLLILNEPLRRVDDVRDRIVKMHGKWRVERIIKKMILNGSEYWIIWNDMTSSIDSGTVLNTAIRAFAGANNLKQGSVIADANYLKTYNEKSDNPWNHSYYTRSEEIIAKYYANNTLGLSILKTRITDNPSSLITADAWITAFKNYLAANPITIYYELEKPEYEDLLGEPVVSIYDKSTSVYTNDFIMPGEITLKNKGWHVPWIKPSTIYSVLTNNSVDAISIGGSSYYTNKNVINTGLEIKDYELRVYSTPSKNISSNIVVVEGNNLNSASLGMTGISSCGDNVDMSITTTSITDPTSGKDTKILSYWDAAQNKYVAGIKLMGINDEIYDEIKPVNGRYKYVQRVGKLLLNDQTFESWLYYSASDVGELYYPNGDTDIKFMQPSGVKIQPNLKADTMLAVPFHYYMMNPDLSNMINYICLSNAGKIYLHIIESELTEKTSGGVLNYLRNNPITVVGALLEPKEYDLGPIEPMTFEGGTELVINSGKLYPHTTFKVSSNIGSIIQTMQSKIAQLEGQNSIYDNILLDLAYSNTLMQLNIDPSKGL